MRDRTDSKQNLYIAGSRLAVENNRLLSTGSNLPQDPAFTGIFLVAEREGLLGASRLAPSGPPFGRYPLLPLDSPPLAVGLAIDVEPSLPSLNLTRMARFTSRPANWIDIIVPQTARCLQQATQSAGRQATAPFPRKRRKRWPVRYIVRTRKTDGR